MTHATIQEQVNVIRKATEKALRSKETAQQFLIDAGIIKDELKVKHEKKSKK